VASIKKRTNGAWRAQVAIHGARQSKDFSTKAEALAWSAELETQLRAAHSAGIATGKTVGQAMDRYVAEVSSEKKGERWERVRCNKLARDMIDGAMFGTLAMEQVNSGVIGQWREMRLKVDKVSGATVNRDLNLLSHIFTVAKDEWKWIAANPIAGVRRPKDSPPRDRLVTPDEIARLSHAMGFDGTPVRLKSAAVMVAFLVAIETGMRAGELCGLRRADIAGNVVTLAGGVVKNGMGRQVPLSKHAMELLALLPEGNDTIFNVSAASVDALFRKGRERAGVENLHFHDSRHEAVTRLAKKLNVLELARMIGHKDIRQLQVYFNKTANDIAPLLD
jgi:integrase